MSEREFKKFSVCVRLCNISTCAAGVFVVIICIIKRRPNVLNLIVYEVDSIQNVIVA